MIDLVVVRKEAWNISIIWLSYLQNVSKLHRREKIWQHFFKENQGLSVGWPQGHLYAFSFDRWPRAILTKTIREQVFLHNISTDIQPI